MRFFLRAFFPILLGLTACQSISAETDFNTVGSKVAIMLQNNHYKRLPLDEELSEVVLMDYLKTLDFNRLHFTGEDVEALRKKYATTLCDLILRGEGIDVAVEIYDLFKKRSDQRMEVAMELLKSDLDSNPEFAFTGDEKVLLNREEAARPKDLQEAKELWKQAIKKAILTEKVSRAQIVEKAKELKKENLGTFDRSEQEKISLFYERMKHNVNDVDREEIAAYFLNTLCSVHGPHTNYVSAREFDRFISQMKNQLVGIGAQLEVEEDGATIIRGIIVGGPADKAGELKLNDRIVGVAPLNGGPNEMVDILFMDLNKVVDLIRGKEGTEVGLKIEPADGAPGETKVLTIERGRVQLKEAIAKAKLIETKETDGKVFRTGIITLPRFYGDLNNPKDRCSYDVEKLLKRLITENIDGLIFDIRGNGGGYLDEVRRMTGFFIDRGPMVQIKDTRGSIEVKETSHRKALYTGPLVILTDRSSASASEILAGALQDYNRAIIVGDASTFGKGTVQQHMDIARKMPFLSDSRRAGQLKPTFQKFYRVAGSSTQLKGVVPDVILPSLLADALEYGERYLDHALKHDEIREAPRFKPLDERSLFRPRLIEKAKERMSKSKDYQYVLEDIARIKKRREENTMSLNIEKRLAEISEDRDRERNRNVERVERFAKIVEEDNEKFTVFRLNLEDIKLEELEKVDLKKDAESYMRRAKKKLAELDDTPEWPNGMDPGIREGLAVLNDLIEVTADAKLVGILKK